MAKASTEPLDVFKQRMTDEGFEAKNFPGYDPRIIVKSLHSWYEKNSFLYELSDEFHPEIRNTFWVRRRQLDG